MASSSFSCGTGTLACALRYATNHMTLRVHDPRFVRVGSYDPTPLTFFSSRSFSSELCLLCVSALDFLLFWSPSMPLRKTILIAFVMFVASLSSPAQEPMKMSPDQMQHHHMNIPTVQPTYPRLGRSQENPVTPLFTLDQAQSLAAASNPTLLQAEAEIRAAKARQQQSGLYPNPTVGYTGDEIRGGSINGGKQGFFVEQTIVTGAKLARSKDVYAREIQLAEIEAQEQKIRVETSVKTAFYRVLAAQELLDARRDLAQIEQDFATAQRQLFNTGQADESELLDAELEAQRLRLFARIQENSLREEWRSLAAVLGKPDLPIATVAGDLEHNWPDLNEDQAVEAIATQSPATRIADADAARAASILARSKRESIPDLQLRGGLEYNNEPLGTVPNAVGWEGLAEVGVQIPIFNRNQGNVAADTAALDRATLEKQRIALTLRERAASAVDEYSSARLTALEYRDEILPRAKKAYTLLVEKYGLMLAANPHVLESQRRLFSLQTEYIMSLENLWTTGLALQGFLLTDGLEAPSHPSDMTQPIRETNLPLPDRLMSPSMLTRP
jgi:outer membrane protein, heavy metal efflux system